jgi:hypothetical protein
MGPIRPRAHEYWYFVHDGLVGGSGYFVGYDVLSKNRIGYWGTNMELSEQPPAPEDRFHCEAPRWDFVEREPINSQSYASASPLWLFGSDRILEIDVPQRLVTTLWQGERIVDYELLYLRNVAAKDADRPELESRVLVRTENQLHFVTKDRKDNYAVPIPEAMRTKVLEVWELPKDGVVVKAPSDLGRNGALVARISKSGASTIVEVPLRDLFYVRPNVWPYLALELPTPMGLIGVWAVGAQGWQNAGRAQTWQEALWAEWPRFWPTLVGSFAVSGVFAFAVRRRHRQFGLRGENLWAAFVFLAGPAGAFAYFLHRAWPVREACPACGVKAPRDRDACFRCGAAFPEPHHISTEIMA